MSTQKDNIFRLSKADNKPMLDFNGDTGIFLISGVSNPENSHEFYTPIIHWLDDFVMSKPKDITLEVRLDYFSTSSSKMILEILKRFELMAKNGTKVKIKWYYFEDDEDLSEAGRQYAELISIPIEVISYTD